MSTHLKYPYRWGAQHVQSFIEKYARGTYFLARLLDISPGEVRHGVVLTLCKGNSIKFESLKRCIKLLEDYSIQDLARFSVKERKLLYKWYVVMCEEDELDARIARDALDMVGNHFLSF